MLVPKPLSALSQRLVDKPHPYPDIRSHTWPLGILLPGYTDILHATERSSVSVSATRSRIG